MKLFIALVGLFYSSFSFADCGYDFGDQPQDTAVCESINMDSVQTFFHVEETAYTNPAVAVDFEVTSVQDRDENELYIGMDVLFAVTYVDGWEPGHEPYLELDSCDVYLTKSDEHYGWEFEYASCNNNGEFGY